MEEKKYPIPEEVIDLWDKKVAAENMRDIMVKLPFGFKKARRCALDAQTFRRKFWHKVRCMYPELDDNSLAFHDVGGTIIKQKHEGE